MNKNHILRTILLSTVFAVLAVVLPTSTVCAHTAFPAHAVTASQIPAALPNVNIVRKGGRSVFSPMTIHCKARGLKTACFTITNMTQKDQLVLLNGKVLGTIPTGFVAGVGIAGQGPGFLTLKANPQALLILIAS